MAASPLFIFAAGPAALAHGGGTPQLTNQPAGDYLVSAWTTPDPATIGTLHVTVALQNASSGEPVTDADVQVVAHPLEGESAEIATAATRDDALTPYFYEADITIPDAGLWQIELALVKAEGAAAERLGFVLEIEGAVTQLDSLGSDWYRPDLHGLGRLAAPQRRTA